MWRGCKQELEEKIEEINNSKMPHIQRVALKIAAYENYRKIFRKNSPMKNAAFTDYQELQTEEQREYDNENLQFTLFQEELGRKIIGLKGVLFCMTMEELGWEQEIDLESHTYTWKKV